MTESGLGLFPLILAGVLGGLIGSFLNVCIHRLPRGGSVVSPRSACPHCGTPIPARRNVPVLSWLLLGGRAACCGRPISPRYLLVEVIGVAMALLVTLRRGASLEGAAEFILLSALVVLFFTDLDARLLPDKVTLPIAAAGLLMSPWRPALGEGLGMPGWLSALVASAAGYVLFLAIGLLWRRIRKVEAVGGGDMKMLAMIGAFQGIPGLVLTLLVSSVVGAGAGIGIAAVYAADRLGPVASRHPEVDRIALAGALFSRGLRRKTVPFGCFLSLGAAFTQLGGERLASWYLGLLS